MVQVDDYVYAVPFVESDTEIFLKNDHPKPQGNQAVLE